jgi:protein O-GlcNAc transferase
MKQFAANITEESEKISLKGVELHRLGSLGEAKNAFSAALALDPANLVALYSLAAIQNNLGQFENALVLIKKFIELRPDFAPAHIAKSIAESGLSRLELARKSLDDALFLDPNLNDLAKKKQWLDSRNAEQTDQLLEKKPYQTSQHSLEGIQAQETGNLSKAVDCFEKALQLNSNDFVALYSLGILNINNENTDGLNLLERATKSEPYRAEGHFALGTALMSKGLYEKALLSLDKAIELNKNYEEAYVNKSNLLHNLKKTKAALETLESGLKLFPNSQKFLNNKGYLLTEQKRHEEAIDTFHILSKINPNYENALGLLAHAKLHACDWKNLTELSQQITEGVLTGVPVTQPFAYMSLTDNATAMKSCAKIFGKYKFPEQKKLLWTGERYKHRKKRVAFLSADLREHAVGYLFKSILDELNTEQFELLAVSSSVNDGSELYNYYKAKFNHYIESEGKPAIEVAQVLRAFEVDITIDLSGFTYGSRLDVLAYRPSPIQITYLGYPGTLSLPYIDYIIGDSVTIPDTATPYYSEQVLRLNSCYLPGECRKSLQQPKKQRSSFGLPENKLVLCSFNHNYKINKDIFSVWMRLLRENKNYILWLMKTNEYAENNLRRYAVSEDVDPKRIFFATRLKTLEEHLSRYTVTDLCLDTFPYNGHTTTYDALSMGVPVISLQGEAFQSRVASSLLTDYQHEQNIALTLDDYYLKATIAMQDDKVCLARKPEICELASKANKGKSFAEILHTLETLK